MVLHFPFIFHDPYKQNIVLRYKMSTRGQRMSLWRRSRVLSSYSSCSSPNVSCLTSRRQARICQYLSFWCSISCYDLDGYCSSFHMTSGRSSMSLVCWLKFHRHMCKLMFQARHIQSPSIVATNLLSAISSRAPKLMKLAYQVMKAFSSSHVQPKW